MATAHPHPAVFDIESVLMRACAGRKILTAAKGHPFFQSDSLITGSAEYDGVYYPSLGLSYDLVKDLVIIPDKQHSGWQQLLNEKLTGRLIRVIGKRREATHAAGA